LEWQANAGRQQEMTSIQLTDLQLSAQQANNTAQLSLAFFIISSFPALV